MAADVPNLEAQDVPKGPETQGDPVLIEAEEALKRASEGETTALDLRDKGLRMTLLDGALKQVNKKIEAEDKKEPKNFDKLSKLVTKKTELEAAQAKIMAVPDAKADEKIAKVEGTLKAHATDLEGRLKEIDRVQARMALVQTEMETYKAVDTPEGQGKYAAALKEMGELTKALAALEKEGTEEKQRAQHEATLAAEKKAAAMREQVHAKEIETADKDLSEFEGNPAEERKDAETPDEEAADEDTEGETETETEGGPEDPDAKAALKKELLHNTLHKAAHGMSVMLEKGYKEEWDNSYEKMVWNGKALFLKALVLFGGTPKWAELLTKEQLGFMKDHVGIEFSKKTVEVKKDGVATNEEKWTYKFVKPLEGGDDGITEMSDVFETVYGREGMAKAMEGIKPETTLADLKATAPESDTSEFAVKTRTLIAAMEQVTPKPTDETKVEEFLTANADKVQKILKPAEETTVAGTPGEGGAEKDHMNPTVSLAEELFPELDKMEMAPDKMRRGMVSRLLVPLSAEDYSYTFDLNTSLAEAFSTVLGSRIKDPQEKAEFEGMFDGTLSQDDLKEIIGKELTETSDVTEVAIFLILAVGIGDLNAKDAQSILDDAKDGKIEPANLEKINAASVKAFTFIGESFKDVSLDTALKEFIPSNDEERARLEFAKKHIGYSKERATDNLVTLETTFELVADSASKLKLDEAGISLSGSKMMDSNGVDIKDFGDAKMVELKTLPDGTMNLIVTPKEGDPSVIEFKNVDELVTKLTAQT